VRWTPLKLTTPLAQHVFGGRRIPDLLGRAGLPDGRIAETWECSDVDGKVGVVQDGLLAGRSLRELATEHPDELVGRGWRGPRFPVLTKFIDGTGMLPVHLHADDEAAQGLEGEPNGKTEAWHILWAAPGATALVGLKPGVDRAALREALLRQDWDAAIRRLPVRPGETVYVPGGTLHSFGPDTLIYEIEQTSDIQQHAMPWKMEDGSEVGPDERRSNIDKLLEELRPGPRPSFRPPLRVAQGEDAERLFCCAGPHFALERWGVAGGAASRFAFDRAVVLSNAGAPAALWCGDGWSGTLGRAETLLLPAALGGVEVSGPADLLAGYLPDLERDIRVPLAAAGYGPERIAALGEGLGG
jgi:mannose-6-phosphate isomerase